MFIEGRYIVFTFSNLECCFEPQSKSADWCCCPMAPKISMAIRHGFWFTAKTEFYVPTKTFAVV
jgi:hypothetical protein